MSSPLLIRFQLVSSLVSRFPTRVVHDSCRFCIGATRDPVGSRSGHLWLSCVLDLVPWHLCTSATRSTVRQLVVLSSGAHREGGFLQEHLLEIGSPNFTSSIGPALSRETTPLSFSDAFLSHLTFLSHRHSAHPSPSRIVGSRDSPTETRLSRITELGSRECPCRRQCGARYPFEYCSASEYQNPFSDSLRVDSCCD